MQLLIIIFLVHLSSIVIAQESKFQLVQGTDFGKSSLYFRYPLDLPPRLNANFGEMRPNHFHMGLDLYTNKRENLPVYAAAEGYVSRIKIEEGGFGNAVYINHPNGLTTLYAHMNSFFPLLEAYIKNEQYKMESWAIDLSFKPDQFPLRKGDFIGLSGNTGASQGPHVHFEIRETVSEKCVNPLHFDFKLLDNIAPDIYSLAFYDRDKSMYEQVPIMIPVLKNKNGCTVQVPFLPFTNVGIAFKGSDRMNGVANSNGVYAAFLFENKKLITGFSLDKMGYDETRYLNAHIDHMHKSKGGGYMQQLFPLAADKSSIYLGDRKQSGISLKDGQSHELNLVVKDAAGNTSKIAFTIKAGSFPKQLLTVGPNGQLMIPDQENIFDSDSIEVYIPEGSIYDTIHFNIQSDTSSQPLSYSSVFQVHDPAVPLHKYVAIRIKPNKVIPYPLRDRMIIRKVTNSNVSVKKANWEMGKYSASFREFGNFELIADDKAPDINFPPKGIDLSNAPRILITVYDDHKSIKNFRATLDEKWLRFKQRGNLFTYVFDEKCVSGEHDLKIFVEDEAGNKAEKTLHFKK